METCDLKLSFANAREAAQYHAQHFLQWNAQRRAPPPAEIQASAAPSHRRGTWDRNLTHEERERAFVSELRRLFDTQPFTPQEVATELGLHVTGMQKALPRLAQAGLLLRTGGPGKKQYRYQIKEPDL